MTETADHPILDDERHLAAERWTKGQLDLDAIEALTTPEELPYTILELENLNRVLQDQQAAKEGDVLAAESAADADPSRRSYAAHVRQTYQDWLPRVRTVQRHVMDTLQEAYVIRDEYRRSDAEAVLSQVRGILNGAVDGGGDPGVAAREALRLIGEDG